jgi:nucleoid DNA-binding protein
VTKKDIARAVGSKLKIPEEIANSMVDQVFDEIRQSLIKRQKVTIPRFGVFESRQMTGKNSRNPRTGEEVIKQPFHRPWFRGSRDLKAILNNGSN